MEQKIISGSDAYTQLRDILVENKYSKMLLVCGKSFFSQTCSVFFSELQDSGVMEIRYFTDFQANPDISSAYAGADTFVNEHCDVILVCGGGSAIDVAKCIRLLVEPGQKEDLRSPGLLSSNTDLIVIPTTAGTGSEATHFAVVYEKGVKLSVSEPGNRPGYVLFDPKLLFSLPPYQKRSAALDALCHCVESAWSGRSCGESRELSRRGLEMIYSNIDAYLDDGVMDERWLEAASNMLMGSNLAGRAIDITTTTAAHAMCYNITKLCGIAHGHAAALCLRQLWRFMLNKCQNTGKIENRIPDETELRRFDDLLSGMKLDTPTVSEDKLKYLVDNVNPERLQNNPVELDRGDIEELYRAVLDVRCEGEEA